MSEPETEKPSEDAKIAQLLELNNRARWYSPQLWHVPFAYLGVTAIAVVGVSEKAGNYLPLLLLACAFLGGCILVHVSGIMDGEKRAVESLQRAEESLSLPRTVEYKRSIYVEPLRFVLIAATVGYAVMGIYLLCE